MNVRHKIIAALMMSGMLLISGCGDDKPVGTRQSNVLPHRNNVDTDLSDIETLDEPAVERKAVDPPLEKIAAQLEQRPPRNLGESSVDVQPPATNKSAPVVSKYGLIDITSTEQKEIDNFIRAGKTEKEAYELIKNQREGRGGVSEGSTKPKIAPNAPLQTEDLMLGAITLGDTYDYVVGRMGEPRSKETTQYGTLMCTYSSMKIGFKDNKVVVMITPSNLKNGTYGLATRRGISSVLYMNHVADAYGTNFNRTVENNFDVFEYRIMSKDNRPALLRFAFQKQDDNPFSKDSQGRSMRMLNPKKKGQIKYINVRYE